MNSIRFLRQKIKTKFSSQSNINHDIYPDDTFIVSYPKSGNTWLRFILANLLKHDDETIDFHSAINYIPEIGTHADILANQPRPRIIKSHHLYNQDYSQVIYLVRDPRDVYVSYYHYLRKSLPKNMGFSEFLRTPNLHPSRWHTHIESWLDSPNILLLVKYEDLLKNTYQEVSKITKMLFQEEITEERINEAIKNSSFERMKKSEQEKGRPFRNKNREAAASTFVRKGQHGDWLNYFSLEDEQFLLNEAGLLMKHLDYV